MKRNADLAKRASAVFALCALSTIGSPAQNLTTLFSFNNTDGASPYASLVQATNGDLYGTTHCGGANGAGTVFEISLSGTLSTLYSFCAQSACADGELPYAPLVQATNGNLYGTTFSGGVSNGGTVFKISQSGTLTTLYMFCVRSGCADGAKVTAGLLQAANGDLYGATEYGGSGRQGTLFQITRGSPLKTLYSFGSHARDGDGPVGLAQAANGDFYGTTGAGGTYGFGTIFKIVPGGTPTTLYSFCSQAGCPDGSYPEAVPVQAANGYLFGTTSFGGAYGAGTVFKVTPTGTLTTLYSFCAQAGCADGNEPVAGLIQATNGDLYGTTEDGGANGYGSVFKITPGGALTTVYSFCSQAGCADGFLPLAALVQHTNGAIYGTTVLGGAYNNGTIFSLSVGLGPFVKTLPTAGKSGTTVKILGSELTGATSVTFNGTTAAFQVVSPSLITTTVPTGATTGTIQVITPGGTLASNVTFQVG